jgi:hypothetical protein
MQIKKILVPGVAVLALIGSVSGVAVAAGTSTAPTPATAETTAPDTDNVQQGDQTSPDVTGQAENPGEATGESSGEAAGEGSSESDGPGGHADPAGQNVDHQFNGEE